MTTTRRTSCWLLPAIFLFACSGGGKGSTPPATTTLDLDGIWRVTTLVRTNGCSQTLPNQETYDVTVVHDAPAGTLRIERTGNPDLPGQLSGDTASFDLIFEESSTRITRTAVIAFTSDYGTGLLQDDREPLPAGTTCSTVYDLVITRLGSTSSGAFPVPPTVPISAGTFSMGATDGELDERPRHTVQITENFRMGKYEVTQREWVQAMGVNRSPFLGDNLPVTRVTWYEARLYCARLNAQEGPNLPSNHHYRLPTEAEWEYCCRAGSNSGWNTGANLDCSDANFEACGHDTLPVGSYPANGRGLFDMHGNVAEWCFDAYDNYPTTGGVHADPFVNPFLPVNDSKSPVIRGGHYNSTIYDCRSARRISKARNTVNDSTTGFRIVLAPILP